MRVWRSTEILTESEMQLVHSSALKVLSEVGAIVQSEVLLKKLAEYGAVVDFQNERVHFPQTLMERFIAESEPVPEDFDPAGLTAGAGTYGAFWMTAEGGVELFTEKSIRDYLKLCFNLDNVEPGSVALPIPSDMGPGKFTPLHMRLLGWKYLEPRGCGSCQVQDHRLIPYIIEMGEVMADRFGGRTGDYISGAIEFQSPFRCSREEAAILVDLRSRGFDCGIGGPMPMAGATAPVTLAGILTQHIAEILFRNVIRRVMNGDRALAFGSGFGLMDMKTGSFLRSRPENALLHLALGQIVHRIYKGWFRGHSFGVVEAQGPSLEAGFETAMNVFTGLLAGNRYAGGLGMVCQPTGIVSALQLILDNECWGLVKRFIKGFEITEETIAFDLMKEVGAGGSFLDHPHTAENFRKEYWQPRIFNRLTYQAWESAGGKSDLDIARDIYYEIMKKDDVAPKIDEQVEKSLWKIIRMAERGL